MASLAFTNGELIYTDRWFPCDVLYVGTAVVSRLLLCVVFFASSCWARIFKMTWLIPKTPKPRFSCGASSELIRQLKLYSDKPLGLSKPVLKKKKEETKLHQDFRVCNVTLVVLIKKPLSKSVLSSKVMGGQCGQWGDITWEDTGFLITRSKSWFY